MEKMSTLFKKDPRDLGRVINEVNPGNEWVFVNGVATRKYDGTACAVINGNLYKRYDLKKGRKLPAKAIPCCDPDPITGHHPHWIPCIFGDNSNKWHFEAFDKKENHLDRTYELCGEKIQGNPERIEGHELIPHGVDILFDLRDITFDSVKEYLENNDIEGIVFYNAKDFRMCKIRKSDFGIKMCLTEQFKNELE